MLAMLLPLCAIALSFISFFCPRRDFALSCCCFEWLEAGKFFTIDVDYWALSWEKEKKTNFLRHNWTRYHEENLYLFTHGRSSLQLMMLQKQKQKLSSILTSVNFIHVPLTDSKLITRTCHALFSEKPVPRRKVTLTAEPTRSRMLWLSKTALVHALIVKPPWPNWSGWVSQMFIWRKVGQARRVTLYYLAEPAFSSYVKTVRHAE